jgi:hypothetical protein
MVAYERDGLPREARVRVTFNTDTLRAALEGLRLTQSLTVGAQLTGEALFGGLLPDYYREGRKDSSRGFWASYFEGRTYLKHSQSNHHTMLTASVRKWLFHSAGMLGVDTNPALLLPAAAVVFEPRLSYTYWRLAGEHGQRHRFFPRVRGLAFGLELGLDLRSEARPWGARDPATFTPEDVRNEPQPAAFTFRQWLRAGLPLTGRLRTQLSQWAFFGSGVDDLNRVRVGGMNPYVVPVAGQPWAAFLAGRLLAVESSWHFKVLGQQEVGLLVDLAWLDDERRTGRSDDGVQAGLGAFADLRFLDRYQLDLRLGWSPTLEAGHSFGLFVALGYQTGI